jgi:hypothetical protein
MIFRLMSKTSIPIFVLAVAFLLSAWGNVISATFCPRYLSNRACFHKSIAAEPKQVEPSSCHHKMGDMEMDDMQTNETKDAVAEETSYNAVPEDPSAKIGIETSAVKNCIEVPAERCGHCWMHSQPASGAATLVAVDPSRQLITTDAPPAWIAVDVASGYTASITPLEHGPPGNVLPRHVLINVFRI